MEVKTAVIDVIGVLRVSPDSSTVHLYDIPGSRRACACSESGVSSQNDDRAWGYTTEERRAVVRSLWANGRLHSKDIRKEMFPIYGEKCFTRKMVHDLAEKFSEGRSKVEDDDRPGRPVEIVIYSHLRPIYWLSLVCLCTFLNGLGADRRITRR
jgi:hypothetical protein